VEWSAASTIEPSGRLLAAEYSQDHGTKLTVAAVITPGVNGQINQVKSIPFWVQ
jgi:hypothetical protein